MVNIVSFMLYVFHYDKKLKKHHKYNKQTNSNCYWKKNDKKTSWIPPPPYVQSDKLRFFAI